MYKDYYEILGVSKDASDKDIKRSFRSLAMLYHPDSNDNPDSHEKFLAINEAYQTLSDPIRRKQYDGRYEYERFIKYSEQVRKEYTYTSPYTSPYNSSTYQAPRRPSRKEEFGRYSAFARLFSWIGLLLSFTLIADYFLAGYSSIEPIENLSITQGAGGELSGMIRTQTLSFILDYKHFDQVGKGDFISTRKTPIFHVVTHLYIWEFPGQEPNIAVQLRSGRYSPETMIQVSGFYPHYGIYNVFSFFLIILLLVSMAGVTIQDRPELLFKLSLLTILLTLISGFILFNS